MDFPCSFGWLRVFRNVQSIPRSMLHCSSLCDLLLLWPVAIWFHALFLLGVHSNLSLRLTVDSAKLFLTRIVGGVAGLGRS